jgi:hypothetical protein
MTTRRVVADDVLGQLARRQHELFRRVMEGTLDPHEVLARLQLMIEGAPDVFPIEKVPLTFSEVIYAVEAEPVPFSQLLDRWPYQWGYKRREDANRFLPDQPPPVQKKKSKLRLAKVGKELEVSAVLHYLRQAEVESADAWEAFAFASVAPFMKLARTGNFKIHIFGTTGILDYQGAEANSLHRYLRFENVTDVTGVSASQDGWHVGIGCLRDSSLSTVYPQDYLLVRA